MVEIRAEYNGYEMMDLIKFDTRSGAASFFTNANDIQLKLLSLFEDRTEAAKETLLMYLDKIIKCGGFVSKFKKNKISFLNEFIKTDQDLTKLWVIVIHHLKSKGVLGPKDYAIAIELLQFGPRVIYGIEPDHIPQFKTEEEVVAKVPTRKSKRTDEQELVAKVPAEEKKNPNVVGPKPKKKAKAQVSIAEFFNKK